MQTPRPAGFTLIELMVVIAVATILAVIAAPGLRDFVVGQRTKTAAFELASSATLARSEAIKRNVNVELQPNSLNPVDWSQGWRIQIVGGTPLATQDALSGVTVAAASGTTASSIQYGTNGRLVDPVPSFQVSGGSSSNTRCVTFDLSGMASSRLGAC